MQWAVWGTSKGEEEEEEEEGGTEVEVSMCMYMMPADLPTLHIILVCTHVVIMACEDVAMRPLMHIQTGCLNASSTMGDTPALLAHSPCALVLQSDPDNGSGL